MKVVDAQKGSSRLVTLGLTVGACYLISQAIQGGAVNGQAATAAAGSAIGFGLGVLKSLVTAKFGEKLTKHLGATEARFCNNDLNRLIGRTISHVVASFSDGVRDRHEQKILKRIADDAPEAWVLLTHREEWPELEPLAEDQIQAFFADHADELASQRALTPEAWVYLLRRMENDAQEKAREDARLSPETVEACAGRLCKTFPHDLRELLKHDYQEDGKAYAGLQMMLWGEIRAEIREIREQNAGRDGQWIELAGRVEENSAAALQKILEAVAQSDARESGHYRDVIGALARLDADFYELVQRQTGVIGRRIEEDGQKTRDAIESGFEQTLQLLRQIHKSRSPFPFRNFDDRDFGSEKNLQSFRPTRREYENRLVHRSHVAKAARSFMDRRGWAYVRGHGATGKTVLGIQLALENGPKLSFYLDFAEYNDAQIIIKDALDTIAGHAYPGVLFILDNVHVDPEHALDLYKKWSASPNGSCLLLLGRHVTHRDAQGRQSPLASLEKKALPLKVSTRNLRRTLCRLALRSRIPGAALPKAPQPVLEKWLEVFGGDLIAFSLAVSNRMQQLRRGQWDLETSHVKNRIRQTFLDGASENERRALLQLAAFARWELDAPLEVLDGGMPEEQIRNGLILRQYHAHQNRETYQFVHAGMGSLLLEAANLDARQFEREVFLGIARQNKLEAIETTTMLAARLEAAGDADDCRTILGEALRAGFFFDLLPQLEIQHVAGVVSRLLRLRLLEAAAIDAELCARFGTLWRQLAETKLERLTRFEIFCAKHLPRLDEMLRNALQRSDGLEMLASKIAVTSLGDLIPFLVHCRRTLPEAHRRAVEEIEKPEVLESLKFRIKSSTFDRLAGFIKYARDNMPNAYARTKAALADPHAIDELSSWVESSNLVGLAGVLMHTREDLPEIHDKVLETLNEPENFARLNQKLRMAPIDQVALVFKYLNTSESGRLMLNGILDAIDVERWNETRGGEKIRYPGAVTSIRETLRGCNRLDLAEAPAWAIIHSVDANTWTATNANIFDLACTVRLGDAIDAAEMERFLTHTIDDEWLKAQYAGNAPDGELANSLWVLWSHLPKRLVGRFATAALAERIRARLAGLQSLDARALSGAIELLGVCEAVGCRLDGVVCAAPGWDVLVRTLKLNANANNNQKAQFWSGFRMLANICDATIAIPEYFGIMAVIAHHAQHGWNRKFSEQNKIMARWLERCRNRESCPRIKCVYRKNCRNYAWRMVRDNALIHEIDFMQATP